MIRLILLVLVGLIKNWAICIRVQLLIFRESFEIAKQALVVAEDQAKLQAKRVVIGIAGELVKGVTNTIRYRRPQPDRPLDSAEMEFIIEKVQERAQEQSSKTNCLETGNENVEVKLVNSALVSYSY